MTRPRDSLLGLFDPLFASADPATPRRDTAPSPDLGSDKENAAPPHALDASPLTLTKFFSRTYTRHPPPPRLLPGRLVDVDWPGDSDDADDDSDPDDDDDAFGPPRPRRPLADIALRGSSPLAVPWKGRSPAASSAALFGSPSTYTLPRATPAPSSSPLASVINAINGTASPPRIAVTPAADPSPSPSPSPRRRTAQLTPAADAEARRASVDLQQALDAHFAEASFDLLKDKICLPEHDSLELYMPVDLGARSHGEPDIADALAERLRDVHLASDAESDVEMEAEESRKAAPVSTPPAQLGSASAHSIVAAPTPRAPARQVIRPKAKLSLSSAPAMPAPPLARPTRSGRGSISALPAPSAPLRIAKKAPAVEAPVRRPTAPASSSVPPRAMALGGVQRPPAHAKVAAPQPTARTTSLGAGRLGPAVKATTGLGPRPSSLRAPTARAASSGMPRPSISGTGAGATRLPMPGAGRPSGVGASASARMLRRP